MRELPQALLGIVIGAGLLAAGAITHRAYLAAAAVIVLLSLVWAVGTWRRYADGVRPAVPGRRPDGDGHQARPTQTRRAWMTERMDERWRRRQEGDGGMRGRTLS